MIYLLDALAAIDGGEAESGLRDANDSGLQDRTSAACRAQRRCRMQDRVVADVPRLPMCP